jgi:hypothetical protein
VIVSANPRLFDTVADKDYLGFWADQTLNARGVVDFLGLNKTEVAKVADVAPASIRYDEKMPRDLLERLGEIANICELVAQFFEGNAQKTALWFKTKNPMFGNISPRDMIRFGRYERLREFIIDAIAENNAQLPAAEHAEATSTAHA